MDSSRTAILQSELTRIVKNIIEGYKPQKIILFGSCASSKINAWSDIDLIVIKDTKKSFYERLEEVIEIAKPNIATDIIVYTPDEEQKLKNDLFYREEIERKGKVIFDAAKSMV